MKRSSGWTVAALVLATTSWAAPARAQIGDDAAAAEALFDEGQRLVQAGKYDEACPKFAESLRLDSGIGTMLYLADCYERTGKTASAWAQFHEAEDMASRQGDKRASTARERADSLEPRLARLTIAIASGGDVAGLDVKRDTTDIKRAGWGVALPVDPGLHTVVAIAPGKKAWHGQVEVEAGGKTASVLVPVLEDEAPAVSPAGTVSTPPASSAPLAPPLPPAPAPAVAPPSLPAPLSPFAAHQRTVAYAVGGIGVASIVVGSIFGFETIAKNNQSNEGGNCDSSNNLCTQRGVDLRSAAKTDGLVSTIFFVAGGAAVAGAAVLYFTAPATRTGANRIGVMPVFLAFGGGLGVTGAW